MLHKLFSPRVLTPDCRRLCPEAAVFNYKSRLETGLVSVHGLRHFEVPMRLTTAEVIPPRRWLDKWGNTDGINWRVRRGGGPIDSDRVGGVSRGYLSNRT